MSELISVIISVYNVEKYLRRCIDSVINQTYKDLEIILVDDGSIDDCGKICDEYKVKDDRVKVIHKENGGVSSARNAGLDIATGSYIAFVDSDDYVAPEMYAKLYSEAVQNKYDVVECNIVFDYASGKQHKYCLKEREFYSYQEMIRAIFERYMLASASNKIYKREVIADVRFKKDITIAEDLLFNSISLKKAKSVKVLEEGLYYYYQREDSVSHLVVSDGNFKEFDVLDIIRNESTSWKTIRALDFWYIDRCIETLQNILKTGTYEEKLEETRKRILKCKWKIFFHKSFKCNECTRKIGIKRRIYVFVLWLCPRILYNRAAKRRGAK
ncbi:MAG: glycosyltransferase [Oscillospiraceae bacterium]|nr:glycosyltransferase [Oscillospiraceae bacterium]